MSTKDHSALLEPRTATRIDRRSFLQKSAVGAPAAGSMFGMVTVLVVEK